MASEEDQMSELKPMSRFQWELLKEQNAANKYRHIRDDVATTLDALYDYLDGTIEMWRQWLETDDGQRIQIAAPAAVYKNPHTPYSCPAEYAADVAARLGLESPESPIAKARKKWEAEHAS
jgi:hypothetical protein